MFHRAASMALLLGLLGLLLATTTSAQSDPNYGGPWRSSLDSDGSCWTTPVTSPDTTCNNRALSIVHGGDWNLQYPYDSMPAFERGWENQADAVKGDFRVNKDNVGMVMHSSPVEVYESFNCWNKKVEEMTTAECEKCKMEVTDYTFISAPELLAWADAKVNVMFCVKEEHDAPRAISTLVEANATHRAFLELGLGVFTNTATTKPPGWDSVFYIIIARTSADIAQLATLPADTLKRAFLIEFDDPSQFTSLSDDIATVHKLGMRAVGCTSSNMLQATYEQHLELYNKGFDVIYSWNLSNAVKARVQVNTQRGLPSP